MGKKKKYSKEEQHILDVLKKLRFDNRPNRQTIDRFLEEYEDLIEQIEPGLEKNLPSQRTVLLSHFKREFANDAERIHTFKLPEDHKYQDKKITSSINTSCLRISRAIKTQTFKLYSEPWITKKASLYIILILQESSRLGNNFIIRANNKDIKEICAVLVNKEKNLLQTINFSEKLHPFFLLILQNEMNVQLLQPYDFAETSWNTASSELCSTENNIIIDEIGLSRTDFSTGNKIIIKPNKDDVKIYMEALLEQENLLHKDKFDLSYIEYFKARLPPGKGNHFNVEQNDPGGAILIRNMSKTRDIALEKQLSDIGLPIGKKIIDNKNLLEDVLLQQIIIRGFISHKELKLEKYEKALKRLEEKKLIKSLEERYVYRCGRSGRCYDGSPFTTKKCPICGKTDKSYKIFKGKILNLDEGQLRELIKELAKQQHYKYRKIRAAFYQNKYELMKITIPEKPELSIYFNTRGLYKPVLRDFSYYPRALLSVNFRGEMKTKIPYIHKIDAGQFIHLLINNKEELIAQLSEAAATPQLGQKKERAFHEALKELKKLQKGKVLDSAKKGNQYEILAYSILNYLFLIADKWGGKSLPDGILGIGAKENRRFIFWDAKCYDDTKLSQYAKKTKAAKDIQYIIKSLEQEDTYEEGKLAHYLFITSNTHKDDFLTVKKTIDESIESLKLIPKKKNSRKKKENPYYARLKQINFCCMNIEDLIGLGEMLDDKETRDTLLRNWNAFEIAFEETITENDGYASIDALKQKLNPVLTAQIFIPQKETHRRDN